jgi:putative peptidoglycan lipid II flippase
MVVGASFALAAVAGLVRDMIIARQFGIGADLDAFYAAFRLPDLLFTVVAGGALATAFIPVLAEFLARKDLDGAWTLGSAVINLVVLIVTGLAALAALGAPLLVRQVIAPGFSAQVQADTAALMRLVLISTVIFGVSAVITSMLHGLKHFLLPALAPVLYPLGVMAGAIWLAPSMGVRGLAVGAILGALLHLVVQVPALVRYGFRWTPALGGGMPAVRRVAALMGPRVLDLGVWHLTLLATTNLASRLDAGSIAALEWGWSVMQFPETIIGTAFGLVALPTLAEFAARRDVPGLRRTLAETLRAVLALTVPAALGLVLLGRPLLGLLYERGAFDLAAGDAVYVALRWYAVGLVGHSCLELVARAFFAQQDTVRPLIIAAVWSSVSVGLGVGLMKAMGHGGLALANSLAISGEVLTLLLVLRHRWNGVEGRKLLVTLARVSGATLIMGATVSLALWISEGAGVGAFATVIFGALAGVSAYLAAAALLGLQELRWPLQIIRGKGFAQD